MSAIITSLNNLSSNILLLLEILVDIWLADIIVMILGALMLTCLEWFLIWICWIYTSIRSCPSGILQCISRRWRRRTRSSQTTRLVIKALTIGGTIWKVLWRIKESEDTAHESSSTCGWHFSLSFTILGRMLMQFLTLSYIMSICVIWLVALANWATVRSCHRIILSFANQFLIIGVAHYLCVQICGLIVAGAMRME